MSRVIIIYRRTLLIMVLVIVGLSMWGIEAIYADSMWKLNMFEPGLKNKIVILDPGHGGADPGAVWDSLYEKTINLNIAERVAQHLDNRGIKVFLTRGQRGGLNPHKAMDRMERRANLNKRKQFGIDHKGNIYVSIHTNSVNDPQVSGVAVFYHNSGDYNKLLAQSVAARIEKQIGSKVLVQQANYMVISENPIPAILIEVGFITNKDDRTKLKDETYLNTLAGSITLGLEDYAKTLGQNDKI